MKLDRVYRVKAKTKQGDEFLVITDSRDRALDFLRAFANPGHYAGCWVECGDRVYDGKNLEDLP